MNNRGGLEKIYASHHWPLCQRWHAAWRASMTQLLMNLNQFNQTSGCRRLAACGACEMAQVCHSTESCTTRFRQSSCRTTAPGSNLVTLKRPLYGYGRTAGGREPDSARFSCLARSAATGGVRHGASWRLGPARPKTRGGGPSCKRLTWNQPGPPLLRELGGSDKWNT